jgi:hypothetical protein
LSAAWCVDHGVTHQFVACRRQRRALALQESGHLAAVLRSIAECGHCAHVGLLGVAQAADAEQHSMSECEVGVECVGALCDFMEMAQARIDALAVREGAGCVCRTLRPERPLSQSLRGASIKPKPLPPRGRPGRCSHGGSRPCGGSGPGDPLRVGRLTAGVFPPGRNSGRSTSLRYVIVSSLSNNQLSRLRELALQSRSRGMSVLACKGPGFLYMICRQRCSEVGHRNRLGLGWSAGSITSACRGRWGEGRVT